MSNPCKPTLDYKIVTLTLKNRDRDYMKINKINRSSFIRQAIQAHKEGKFDYNYL